MMPAQHESPAASIMEQKKEMLHAIYGVYLSWAERFPFACQKGCAACCTQSVTMTSLEGEVILDFINAEGRKEWLLAKLTQTTPGKSKANITTNQFAAACINHREIDEDALGGWDFTPCVFLEDNNCSIYAVRPFGCRSFGSLEKCEAGRAAEMPPIYLTVNTVLTQIIEHVSSSDGCWSTMADILQSLVNCETRVGKINLLQAQPMPGFLLEPHEMQVVKVLLQELCGQFSGKTIFGDLIDNFIPI
jgi:Fe-S-cluster containining protein